MFFSEILAASRWFHRRFVMKMMRIFSLPEVYQRPGRILHSRTLRWMCFTWDIGYVQKFFTTETWPVFPPSCNANLIFCQALEVSFKLREPSRRNHMVSTFEPKNKLHRSSSIRIECYIVLIWTSTPCSTTSQHQQQTVFCGMAL